MTQSIGSTAEGAWCYGDVSAKMNREIYATLEAACIAKKAAQFTAFMVRKATKSLKEENIPLTRTVANVPNQSDLQGMSRNELLALLLAK